MKTQYLSDGPAAAPRVLHLSSRGLYFFCLSDRLRPCIFCGNISAERTFLGAVEAKHHEEQKVFFLEKSLEKLLIEGVAEELRHILFISLAVE
jgi:hypothetical protein